MGIKFLTCFTLTQIILFNQWWLLIQVKLYTVSSSPPPSWFFSLNYIFKIFSPLFPVILKIITIRWKCWWAVYYANMLQTLEWDIAALSGYTVIWLIFVLMNHCFGIMACILLVFTIFKNLLQGHFKNCKILKCN